MMNYRSFGFFIKDGLICIIDPRTSQIVMIKSADGVEDTTTYAKSMIDQYITDCIGAQYRYESWVRHNLTGKQYHEWRANNSKRA
jgi:hypothetical protein